MEPHGLLGAPATLRGTYHLLHRFLSKEATLSALQIRLFTSVGTQSWFALSATTTSWMLAEVNGGWLSPVTATNAWLPLDAGQVSIPPEPVGGLTDATQNFATLRAQWVDTAVGGAVQQASWQALLPVDASLLLGVVNNPGNSAWTASGWVYVCLDGLGVASGGRRRRRGVWRRRRCRRPRMVAVDWGRRAPAR